MADTEPTGEMIAALEQTKQSRSQQTPVPWWRAEAPYLLMLLAAYLLPLIIVSPIAEFPLIDDWAYAQSVRQLVEEGHLHISNWSAANLVFQIIW